MMDNYPFTTPGVAAWLAALYALPEAEVEKEASEAEYDFKKWLQDRFGLNEAQVAFLEELDGDLTDSWGSSTAFFIRHRMPIELDKPEQTPEVRSSKLVLSKEELSPETQGKGRVGQEFTGLLRFVITY